LSLSAIHISVEPSISLSRIVYSLSPLSLSAIHIYREENAIADHLSKLALSRPLNLSAIHIYREENVIADHLSKLALSRPLGFLTFSRWEKGNKGPPILIKIGRGCLIGDRILDTDYIDLHRPWPVGDLPGRIST
jgi:hypothetical protein